MKRHGAILVVVLFWSTLAAATVHEVPADFATIQAAVDAAANGDTVMVAAGIYEEQVVVTTSLALLGAGPGLTTVQAPPAMSHGVGSHDYRAVISVEEPAVAVTMAGFTVDGLKRHPEAGIFAGILFYHLGGVLADLEVVNVHPYPTTDVDTGIGVLVIATTYNDPVDVALTDVTVKRFQKSGVALSGAYYATLERVIVDTDGVYSDAVQNGIEFGFLRGVQMIDCEVHNVTYDGTPFPQYTAVGILGYRSIVIEITDTETSLCQTGIYLVHTKGEIDNVTIVAPPSSATYCHGLVSVGTIVPGAARGENALPEPQPSFTDTPPTRPQNTTPLRIRDCVLDGNDNPSSRGLAVRSLIAEALDLVVERCLIHRWETGVISLEGSLSAVYGRLSGCRLENNLTFGAYANTITPLDTRGCWWGDPTGPYHPVYNPLGLGNTVSDNVLVYPWLMGNLAPLPSPQAISLSDHDGIAYTDTVSVEYLGGAEDELYAFSVKLTWDPTIVSAVTVERPIRGAFADAVAFEIIESEDHVLVDAALGGAQAGIESGPLFTVHFAAVGTPDWVRSPLQLQLYHARNSRNEPVSGFVVDPGAVTVDLQPPLVQSVIIRNETLVHTDEYAKDGDLLSVTAFITDDDPAFDRGSIRGIPPHLWNTPYLYVPPDVYVAPQAYWAARPAWLTPTDGPAPAFAEARDPSGNWSVMLADTILADNTLPEPVDGFLTSPDHNQAHLVWNDATGHDLNYRRTVVRANRWSDYPFYDVVAPDYPALLDDGDAVYSGDGTAVDPTYPADGSERDILYFSALVEDLAGNVSVVDPGSRARATNYRLGDVRGHPESSPGDGVVDIYDLSRLGDTYGLLRAEPGFDGDCDVGPADGGATGIPVPDEVVEFEDLMIFADQFHLDDVPPPLPASGDLVQLAWRRVAPRIWALELLAEYPRLKGVRLEGVAGPATLQLAAGPLLRAQPGAWFLHPGRGGCTAHLAMLGHGVGMVGTGELLRLTATEPVDLPTPTVTLRDVDNQPLDCGLPTAVAGDPPAPRVFRALPAHPNPFNPSTEIAFDLPARQHVHLMIYDPAGRHVATLVDGTLPAARHAIPWHGRDHAGRAVAAGTYLYRLEAGPWSASGKLQLVK